MRSGGRAGEVVCCQSERRVSGLGQRPLRKVARSGTVRSAAQQAPHLLCIGAVGRDAQQHAADLVLERRSGRRHGRGRRRRRGGRGWHGYGHGHGHGWGGRRRGPRRRRDAVHHHLAALDMLGQLPAGVCARSAGGWGHRGRERGARALRWLPAAAPDDAQQLRGHGDLGLTELDVDLEPHGPESRVGRLKLAAPDLAEGTSPATLLRHREPLQRPSSYATGGRGWGAAVGAEARSAICACARCFAAWAAAPRGGWRQQAARACEREATNQREQTWRAQGDARIEGPPKGRTAQRAQHRAARAGIVKALLPFIVPGSRAGITNAQRGAPRSGSARSAAASLIARAVSATVLEQIASSGSEVKGSARAGSKVKGRRMCDKLVVGGGQCCGQRK